MHKNNISSLLAGLFLVSALLFLVSFAEAAPEIKISGVLVEKISNLSYQAAVSKLESAIKGARMVVIGEPNYQMMQRMVGRERRGSKAYFIFRPDLGIPIFDNDYNAAMEIPIKILIYEGENWKAVIRYKKPSSVLDEYKGLKDMGKELDELIGKITDAALK